MYHTSYNNEIKQWNGPKWDPSMDLNQSMGIAILHSLEINASRIAQVNFQFKYIFINFIIKFLLQICAATDKTITFSELFDLAKRAAKHLQKFQLQKGDVLGFFTSNNSQTTPLLIAATCLGLLIALVPPFLSKNEFIYMLERLKPKIILCDSIGCELVKECLSDLKIEATIFTFDDSVAGTKNIEELFKPIDDCFQLM